MKFSENIEKTTLPGKKKVLRILDNEEMFFRDAILLDEESDIKPEIIYHPVYPEKNTWVKRLKFEDLLVQVVKEGIIIQEKKTLAEIHNYLVKRASQLPDEHKRFISPHLYKVGISEKLMKTRNTLAKQIKTAN